MLVTAPAGFGKSWLVADWLDAHADVAQCWVTVDRLDNDPIRLWRHVIESVRLSACPDASVEAQRLLSSAAAGLPLIVDALAAGLAELDEDMIIVLDDVHALESVEAVRSLRRFLDLLSPRVHLVLVGRHDAAIPLSKYRLAGDVVELRTDDLRCSFGREPIGCCRVHGFGSGRGGRRADSG